MSFIATVLVVHLGLVRFGWNFSGGTTSYFIAAYFIAFYGVFRGFDKLKADTLRNLSLSEFNTHLRDRDPGTRAPMLKWSLVSLALIYFGSGIAKVIQGPVWEWVQPWSLLRHMQRMEQIVGDGLVLKELFVVYPTLAFLGAAGTIVLEVGFLVAVVSKRSITPFVVGFVGMIATVALSMGPFFFDVYMFLLLFADWERLFSNPSDQITVVYDEHFLFCVQSLLPFRLLDAATTVSFHSQYTTPESIDPEEYPLEEAMFVFDGEQAYRGYFAFRRLLTHYPALRPVAKVMQVGLIERIGQQVYRRIADNRSRYFTCSVDLDSSDG